jgi:steroid 5-alpha reductase family enzyme
MENLLTIYAINFGIVTAMMIAGWLISLARKNVTIADTLWGTGFILTAWTTFALSNGWYGRKWLLVVLTTIWGVRLAAYMIVRGKGKNEDPRYCQWRKEHGVNFWIVSLYKVFLVQALFLWLIALSLQTGIMSEEPATLTTLDLCGLLLWLAGFATETIADQQLYAFKCDPLNEGKIMDSGLWKYSRHPNYFGETLVWWGIFFIGLSAPGSFWTIISPLLITFVLVKITGVAITEKNILDRKPEYRDYIRKTSAFVPWPPKK